MAQYMKYRALRYATEAYAGGAGYDTIQWESSGRDRMNPCLHRRARYVQVPWLVLGPYGGTYGYICEWYKRLTTPVTPLITLNQCVQSNADFQAARSRAWHNMLPRFEGRISMLNFLFELKDFRDVAKHIFRYSDFIAKFRKRYKPRKEDMPLPGYSGDPTKPVAGSVLATNLMLLPMAKDLANICQQMNIIVSEAQQAFADAGSELQSSHYSEEIERSVTVSKVNTSWYRTQTSRVGRYTATLRYTYDYSMRDNFLAWMKYWGLCGSFEAFWNGIPFSFVADYFVRIGASIRAMEHDANVDLLQHSYCESIKTTHLSGIVTYSPTSIYDLIVDDKWQDNRSDHLLCGHEGIHYNRWLAEPYYGPASLRFRKPNTRQKLNMACLLRCLL